MSPRPRWSVPFDYEDDAKERGSLLHKAIEKYILGKVPAPEIPEFAQFLAFLDDNPEVNLRSVDVERRLRVGNLNGRLDAAYFDKATGGTALIEWKRCRDPEDTRRDFGNFLHPYKDTKASTLARWGLQLSLLAAIYPGRVTKLVAVVFHPAAPSYRIYVLYPMDVRRLE